MNAPLTPSTLKPAMSTDWPADAVPQSWIDNLFARMSAMYGSKFADLWRGTDLQQVRRTWGIELAGLTNEELRAGVAALRMRPFPPTLPELIALCKPPMNYDAALYEAAQQLRLRAEGKDSWSKPALYWAALKVGEFDMLNLAHGLLIKRFTAALDEVLRGEVHPVPPRAVALPAPGQARANPDRVRAAMATVRALRRPVGNRNWAHRIVEREKCGEKINITVLEMARRAVAAPAVEAEVSHG